MCLIPVARGRICCLCSVPEPYLFGCTSMHNIIGRRELANGKKKQINQTNFEAKDLNSQTE